MKTTLFLGALCVAATSASAEPSPTNSSSSDSSSSQLICRNQQDTTSLVGHVRVCLTREQWAQQRRNGPPRRTSDSRPQ
jgi:hypothetical protein